MVNSQVVREINNAFKIDERVSTTPNAIPVIEVGLKATKTNIIRNEVLTNALSTIVYTTPTKGDFYLDYAIIDYISEAGANITGHMTITYEGVKKLLRVVDIAGATTKKSLCYSGKPIKIDKGTNISINLGTAEVTTSMSGLVVGHIDEVD